MKYVRVPAAQRAWWDDLYQLDRSTAGADRVQVFEATDDPRPTGLLDAQGNELFRVTEKRPIGFTILKESH